MSSVKIFDASHWDGQLSTEQYQIKIASGGLMPNDRREAEKRLDPAFLHWLSGIETHPDCFYVSKVAMGGSHRYGPNRWGDGFREEVLKRDVKTFESAKAYRQHKSDGPYYGQVKLARFREDDGFVDLVTEYFGTDAVAKKFGGLIADDEIEELQKHGHISVSMGSLVPGDQCFPAGTLITTQRGLVAIEMLRVGDVVLTHLGRWRTVRKIGQRWHDGEMVTLQPRNHLHPLVTSSEHPYYVLRRDAVRQPGGRRRDVVGSPIWVAACDVAAGDFVLSPVFDCDPIDTLDVARLFGCYAGNGSRIIQRTGKKKDGPHRLMGFTISGNLAQPEIRQDVAELISRVAVNAATLKQDPGKNGYDLRTYDQHLAARLVSECGDLCENKRVPSYLYAASITERLAFIGGLLDTDGSVDPKSGLIRIPLSTERLVTDTYLLALSCGIRGSVSEHTGGGFGGEGEGQVICLSVAASHFSMLAPYSWKVKNWGCSRKPGGVAFDYEHGGVRYVALEVTSLLSSREQVRVYNLSVDEDESYVAEGVVVHNCVICNHWAPKPKDRCESRSQGGTCELFGCKTGMLRVSDDGRMNFVDNPINRFYDISKVRVGADPIACGLLLPIGDFQIKSAELVAKTAEFAFSTLDLDQVDLSRQERVALDLAYYWSDLEPKAAGLAPDDLDAGYVLHTTPGLSLTRYHRSGPETRHELVRGLVRDGQLPDFVTFAKSAGWSQQQIDHGKTFLPNLYTRLIRTGALVPALKRAGISRISVENDSSVFASRGVVGIDLSSVTRRALLHNANSGKLVPRKLAAFDEAIPTVVTDYAAIKLAYFVAKREVDTAVLRGVVRRDLFDCSSARESA